MQLPNRNKAYIPPSKLAGYLLSETHAVGRSKPRFLRAGGFDETNVALLEHDLLSIARTGAVVEVDQSFCGTKYVVDGSFEKPDGAPAEVRTIWIVEAEDARRALSRRILHCQHRGMK